MLAAKSCRFPSCLHIILFSAKILAENNVFIPWAMLFCFREFPEIEKKK